MRVVFQRVSRAAVTVDGRTVGEIGPGAVVFVGVTAGDTAAQAAWLAAKTAGLRLFADEAGRLNRSVLEVGGGVLAVSNFTLYGDCSHGRRPEFLRAARPEQARPVFDLFVEELRRAGVARVQTGVFGADMQVTAVNDGPITLILEKEAAPCGDTAV